MPDESYVRIEQRLCRVCGQLYDTNGILIHKRLQNIPPEKAITGWGLCVACGKLFNEGYVALIVCDESKSTVTNNRIKEPQDAWRTGEIIHIRKHVFEQIFNVSYEGLPAVFIDTESASKIKAMMPKPTKEATDG